MNSIPHSHFVLQIQSKRDVNRVMVHVPRFLRVQQIHQHIGERDFDRMRQSLQAVRDFIQQLHLHLLQREIVFLLLRAPLGLLERRGSDWRSFCRRSWLSTPQDSFNLSHYLQYSEDLAMQALIESKMNAVS